LRVIFEVAPGYQELFGDLLKKQPKYGKPVRCVRICMRKTFQNMLKLPKIGKNLLKLNLVISSSYNNLRGLGGSEVRVRNQMVGGLNPSVGFNNFNGLQSFHLTVSIPGSFRLSIKDRDRIFSFQFGIFPSDWCSIPTEALHHLEEMSCRAVF
jgi:hypothetical protein